MRTCVRHRGLRRFYAVSGYKYYKIRQRSVLSLTAAGKTRLTSSTMPEDLAYQCERRRGQHYLRYMLNGSGAVGRTKTRAEDLHSVHNLRQRSCSTPL